jgi:hypothetical protein
MGVWPATTGSADHHLFAVTSPRKDGAPVKAHLNQPARHRGVDGFGAPSLKWRPIFYPWPESSIHAGRDGRAVGYRDSTHRFAIFWCRNFF